MYKRKIRSFVSRGRITQGQSYALEVLAPRYCLRLEDGMLDFSAVFGCTADVIMDIGFGTGDSLLTLAARHPENNYLGVEVYAAGIGKLLLKVEQLALKNIRIYKNDVIDILNQCIKDESL